MYPIPSYMKVLKLRPDNKLDWPSPLKFDDDVYAFQKEFQIWLIWPVIHFAVLCCWEDCTVSGSCQHIALSLHDGALTYICGHKLCSQTLISGSVPKPMYWIHDRITPSLNAVAPEGPKIMDMHYWILVSSLVHRDFSELKGSFDDIMCCRWWDIQIQLFTEKH